MRRHGMCSRCREPIAHRADAVRGLDAKPARLMRNPLMRKGFSNKAAQATEISARAVIQLMRRSAEQPRKPQDAEEDAAPGR